MLFQSLIVIGRLTPTHSRSISVTLVSRNQKILVAITQTAWSQSEEYLNGIGVVLSQL